MQTITLILNLPSSDPTAALAFLKVKEDFASTGIALNCFHQEDNFTEIADLLLKDPEQLTGIVVVHHSFNRKRLAEILQSPLKTAFQHHVLKPYYLEKKGEVIHPLITKYFKPYSELKGKYAAVSV